MIYSFICMIAALGSIGVFVLGLCSSNLRYPYFLWLYGLLFFFLFPIVFELILNLKAVLIKNSTLSPNNHNC